MLRDPGLVSPVSGSCADILVEGNLLRDPTPASGTHSDLIQIFGMTGAGRCPRRITIRRNHFLELAGGSNAAQGLFICDPRGDGARFTDILGEENVFGIRHAHAIYIEAAGPGCVIRKNAIGPRQGDLVPCIRTNTKTGRRSDELAVVDTIAPYLNLSQGGQDGGENVSYGSGAGPFTELAGFLPLAAAALPDEAGTTAWLRAQPRGE